MRIYDDDAYVGSTLIWIALIVMGFVGGLIMLIEQNWERILPVVIIAISIIMAGFLICLILKRSKRKAYLEKGMQSKTAALLKSDVLVKKYLPTLQQLEDALSFGPPPSSYSIETLSPDDALEFAEKKASEMDEVDSMYEKAFLNETKEYAEQLNYFDLSLERCAEAHPELLISKNKNLVRAAFNILSDDYQTGNNTKEVQDFDRLQYNYYDNLSNEISDYYASLTDELESGYPDEKCDVIDYSEAIEYLRSLAIKNSIIISCKKCVLSLASITLNKNGVVTYWEIENK